MSNISNEERTRRIERAGGRTIEELLANWHRMCKERNRARWNLRYLCTQVLGYPDVCLEVHKEIFQNLQRFPQPVYDDPAKPNDPWEWPGTDHLTKTGQAIFKPQKDIWELEGPRNTLILFPRGHLKTTIITIAHCIQWILNYPNIRILISTATGDQCTKMLREIKGHFQFNKVFRGMFPDYCPPAKKAADFGSQDEFTIPNRTLHRKEPTVSTCSVGKVIAGAHYEVIKNSDLVDKENVKTPGQIADVISHFGYLNPLLERSAIAPYHGWTDVEGTRYDFGDLYGRLLSSGTWRTVVRPRDGEDTVWPARFPVSELKRIEREIGPQIFSAQYRNKPVPPEGGLCDPKDIVFIPRHVVSNLMPALRLHCTVDLHGLEPSKNDNDYTALTVHGFDRDGRMYVIDIRHGRFTPHEVIWHVFDIHARYPHLIDFKVEKDAAARVLLPFLQREMSKRQRFPIVVPIRRDTHTSKQQRIRGLQSWFKAGTIRFAEDLTCKPEVILEIMQFPSQSTGVHDDILDTLADAMQNSEGDGGVNYDVMSDPYFDPKAMFGMQKPKDRFLGFGAGGQEEWLYGNEQKILDEPLGVL